MKRHLLAGAALITGIGVANAAELVVKAPVPVAAPFSWTGFYVGAHAGGGALFDAGWAPSNNIDVGDVHGVGALAGGQVGANYQTGMLVLGIEGEAFWSGLSNRKNFFSFNQNLANVPFGSSSVSNKWDVDIAARFGVAVNRALVYGKAGWVWGGFDWNYQNAGQPFNPGVPLAFSERASRTLDGLLVGVGVEYAFANNWTAKFEYDYLGFAAKDVQFTSTRFPPPDNTYTQTVSADKHIFKFGVNRLFNAPESAAAKYSNANAALPFSWTGFYAGAHAGGGVLFDAGWIPGPQAIPLDRHGIGALAGGQVGANYQVDRFVLGVEAEGFWSDLHNRINLFSQVPGLANTAYGTASVRNRWDFDIAARFGVTFDRALVYGKAGWVWGRFDWNYNNTAEPFNPAVPLVYSENGSANLDGLLIGLGLEYAFADNWTAKFEYDYLGFDTRDVRFTTTRIPPPNNTYTQAVSVDKHILKFGVNYLFNSAAPVDAKHSRAALSANAALPFSWTGLYLGGHAGGGVLFDAGWTGRRLTTTDRHGIGALAGGQIGANYQTGMLVLGIEAEAFWSGIGNTVNSYQNFPAPNTLFATGRVNNRWDVDIAARAGIAFDRSLVYGKAGWVWGGFNWNYADTVNFAPSIYTETAAATLDGLLIGVGLEHAFAGNWTAKFEYDYLGFSTKDVRFSQGPSAVFPPPNNSYTQTVSANKHIFKFGVNYLFNTGSTIAR